MPVTRMFQMLNNAGYLCTREFAAQFTCAVNTKPIPGSILQGDAGTGKTYLPEIFAKVTGAEHFFYQCFPGTREEDLLVQLMPDETAVSGMRRVDGVVVRALKATAEGRRVVLTLDEFDKTRPSADSFLLNLLQNLSVHQADCSIQGDPSLITIFLTLNFERELSEPLLRRLPKMDFAALPVEQVKAALQLTHKDNPLLDPMCGLYLKTLQAKLPKPATIQELRQLMDAIALLGQDADWDTLVRQFVTKTNEAHALLKSVEKEKIVLNANSLPRLNGAAYQMDPKLVTATEKRLPELPPLIKPLQIKPLPLPSAKEKIYGSIPFTPAAYNAVVACATGAKKSAGSSAEELGGFAKVVGDEDLKAIIITKAFAFEGFQDKLAPLEECNGGEITLCEKGVSHAELVAYHQAACKDNSLVSMRFDYFTDSELSGLFGAKTRFHWNKTQGLTVVCDLSAWDEACDLHEAWDGEIGFPALRAQRLKEEQKRRKEEEEKKKRAEELEKQQFELEQLEITKAKGKRKREQEVEDAWHDGIDHGWKECMKELGVYLNADGELVRYKSWAI